MGKAARIGKYGGPWCDGCTNKPDCDPKNPTCDQPEADRGCMTCRWAVGFAFTATGRFKKDTIGNCSSPVEWPKLPIVIQADMLPRKGGWGNPSNCWSGGIKPTDGKDCPCWDHRDNAASKCPFGAATERLCTPSRAADCGSNPVCGRKP